MKTRLFSALLAGLFLSLPAFASTTQVLPISFSTTVSCSSCAAGNDWVASGILPASGPLPLVSFEFSWDLTFSASATTSADTSEENFEFISGNTSGTYFIGSSPYAGNGGGSGDGSTSPNEPLSFSFAVKDDTVFQAADAGISYNPYILADVTGLNPFNSDFSAGFGIQNYSDLSVDAAVSGALTVTYTYAPEPSTAGLMSLVLLGGMALLRRRIV